MKGKIFEGIAFAQDIRAMKPIQQRHKRQTFEGIVLKAEVNFGEIISFVRLEF